jgi:hypothetical protein
MHFATTPSKTRRKASLPESVRAVRGLHELADLPADTFKHSEHRGVHRSLLLGDL